MIPFSPPGEITFKDPKSYISTAAQGATGTSIGESMLQDDGVTIQISKNAQVSWMNVFWTCFFLFNGFYGGKSPLKNKSPLKGEDFLKFRFSKHLSMQIQGDTGGGKRYGLPTSLAQWFVVQVAYDFGDRPWLSWFVDTALLAKVATHCATLETALLGRLWSRWHGYLPALP